MDKQNTLDLSSAANDVLRQLFKNGPTWDGNLVSKVGRGELVALDLAERYNGYQWLTMKGVQYALNILKLDKS